MEKEELIEAFKDLLNSTSNADSTAAEYLFLSDAAAVEFANEISDAYHALVAAYPLFINDDPDDMEDPDFGDIFNTSAPEACELTDEAIDNFFAGFDAIYEYENAEEAEQEDCDNQDQDDNGDGNDEGGPEGGEDQECEDSNGGGGSGCSWTDDHGWIMKLKMTACLVFGSAVGTAASPVALAGALVIGAGTTWLCQCQVCDDPVIC